MHYVTSDKGKNIGVLLGVISIISAFLALYSIIDSKQKLDERNKAISVFLATYDDNIEICQNYNKKIIEVMNHSQEYGLALMKIVATDPKSSCGENVLIKSVEHEVKKISKNINCILMIHK